MNVYFHAAAALLLRRNASIPKKLVTEWTPESILALWIKLNILSGRKLFSILRLLRNSTLSLYVY